MGKSVSNKGKEDPKGKLPENKNEDVDEVDNNDITGDDVTKDDDVEENLKDDEGADEVAPVVKAAPAVKANKGNAAAVVEEPAERTMLCQGLVNHKCSIGDQKRIIIEKNKQIRLRQDIAVILQRSQKVIILR